MSRKFINKIAAERVVVSSVNNHYDGFFELEGMTRIAINNWALRNGMDKNDKRVEVLLVVSDLCQSMSDRSQESFKKIDGTVMEEINRYLPKILCDIGD